MSRTCITPGLVDLLHKKGPIWKEFTNFKYMVVKLNQSISVKILPISWYRSTHPTLHVRRPQKVIFISSRKVLLLYVCVHASVCVSLLLAGPRPGEWCQLASPHPTWRPSLLRGQRALPQNGWGPSPRHTGTERLRERLDSDTTQRWQLVSWLIEAKENVILRNILQQASHTCSKRREGSCGLSGILTLKKRIKVS